MVLPTICNEFQTQKKNKYTLAILTDLFLARVLYWHQTISMGKVNKMSFGLYNKQSQMNFLKFPLIA